MSYPVERHGSAEGLMVLVDMLPDLLPKFLALRNNMPPPVVSQLTFRDVVEYFVNQHPGDASIHAGALLRQSHPRGHLIFQVFLGADDDLCLGVDGMPYGREIVALALDSELAGRLNNTDLLIFR